ncbi:nuclear transport factor 2 family protein [Streptomyces sp. MMG1121]|uniref:nuclear transport factor 2 family protein n=1 Tax=Streptomyces sp. MMG1121 TaxID=1415544 RepID=UPI0006AF0CD2|nr:nuclear transport factor 2 family protein [Streptomyces sp. MMG1121]
MSAAPVAYGMTGSVGGAEDLVQDAFLGLTRARRAESARLADRFFAAAAGGDLDALLSMLAPDAVFQGDGGKAQALAASATGPRRIGRLLVGGFRRVRALGAVLEPAWVNGRPGGGTYDAEGRVASVVVLDIADGAVRAVHAVSNPDKLAHLGPVSGIGLLPGR